MIGPMTNVLTNGQPSIQSILSTDHCSQKACMVEEWIRAFVLPPICTCFNIRQEPVWLVLETMTFISKAICFPFVKG